MKFTRSYAESLWVIVIVVSMIIALFWILMGDIVITELKQHSKDLSTFILTVVIVAILFRWVIFHTGMVEEEDTEI